LNLFLEFLDKLRHVGLEWYKRYYSTYPAIVVDNNDPEKRGRIKFKCPSVFGKDYISEIWADPSDERIAGKGHGEFLPPYIGDWVEMCFEYGDTKNPIYHGGFFGLKEIPTDFSADYPNVRGWVFASGSKLLVGESKGKEFVNIIHKSGTFIKLNPDGSISASCTDLSVKASGKANIETGGDTTIKAGGKVVINASGEVDVTAGGNIVAKGAQIQMNGSSGQVLTTVTDPVVDLITGAPTIGVPTVLAG